MIPIARPLLGDEEFAAVREVLASGILAQGERIRAFEEAFAAYEGRKHGIAVANGTAALQLALMAHGIRRGHEVLIPPLSFFATASTVLLCGARPAFVDIDPSTYTMDPAKVAEAVSRKTTALVPVHLYGQTAEMDPILEVAREKDLTVIEDACQAHGAEYRGKKAGNLGDTACFSFYATKNMTTGEGGMIVTDDADVAQKARLLRDHGQASKYRHVVVGTNARMTEVAAAIGLVQLRKLDGWVARRRANASELTKRLQVIKGLVPPAEGPGRVHSFYQYVVRVESDFPMTRDEIVKALEATGVGARPSYPMALYRQDALRSLRLRGRCPVAESIIERLFELPVHPGLTAEDVDRIANNLLGLGGVT